MSSKSKKTKSQKKPAESSMPLDDVDTTVLSRGQLDQFCERVHEALTRERQEREVLRLDRDKLSSMAAVARRQLASLRGAVRDRECELHEAVESHRQTMEDKRQALVHLRSEGHAECLEAVEEKARTTRRLGRGHEGRVGEITSDIDTLKRSIVGLDTKILEARRRLEVEHTEEKCRILEKYKGLYIVNESQREKTVNIKIKQLNDVFEREIKELEKRKNNEIAKAKTHYAALTHDLKHYYNKLVGHNLDMVNTNKAELVEAKKSNAAVEKRCVLLRKENVELEKSLDRARTEEEELNERLASSTRDQTKLKHLKFDLQRRKKTVDLITWEMEAMDFIMDKQKEQTSKIIEENEIEQIKARTRAEEVLLILEHMASHLRQKIDEVDATLIVVREVCPWQMSKWRHVLPSGSSVPPNTADDINYRLATVAEERDKVICAYNQLLLNNNIHPHNTGFDLPSADELVNNATNLGILVGNAF